MFPIYTKSTHYAGIRGFNTALNLIYVVYSGLSIIENKAGTNQSAQDYKRLKFNFSNTESNISAQRFLSSQERLFHPQYKKL